MVFDLKTREGVVCSFRFARMASLELKIVVNLNGINIAQGNSAAL
jgi:hypothetical protein